MTIFSQYGEPVHVNLVRDKDTGKSKGFAFLKYEDQRSTDLAVDNLGGATVMGRVLRVDHTRYKRKEDEGQEDNVARIMGPTRGADEDTDTEERRKSRRRDGDESDVEERPRQMLKEERELAELLRDHDDEDPMKEYLIQEKKEEVARALEALKASEKKPSSRRKDSRERSHRHRHHRRKRSEDGSRERSHRDRDNASRRERHRDRSESPRRRRDRSRERSRRERD